MACLYMPLVLTENYCNVYHSKVLAIIRNNSSRKNDDNSVGLHWK